MSRRPWGCGTEAAANRSVSAVLPRGGGSRARRPKNWRTATASGGRRFRGWRCSVHRSMPVERFCANMIAYSCSVNRPKVSTTYTMFPLRNCRSNSKPMFPSRVFEMLCPERCPPMCRPRPPGRSAFRPKSAKSAGRTAPAYEVEFKSTPPRIIENPLCDSHFWPVRSP